MAGDDVQRLVLGLDLGQFVSNIERAVSTTGNLQEAFDNLTSAGLKINTELQSTEATIRGVTNAGDKMVAVLRGVGSEARLLTASVTKTSDAQKAFNEAMRLGNAAVEGTVEFTRQFILATNEAADASDAFGRKLAASLKDVQAIQEQNVRTTEAYAAALDKVAQSRSEFDVLRKRNEELEDGIKLQQEAAEIEAKANQEAKDAAQLDALQQRNVAVEAGLKLQQEAAEIEASATAASLKAAEEKAQLEQTITSIESAQFDQRLALARKNLADRQQADEQELSTFKAINRAEVDTVVARFQREHQEREKARVEAERDARIRERDAAAFGASIGGGNLSFVNLGRSARVEGAGPLANFGIGLGAGLLANGADQLVNVFKQGAAQAEEFNRQVALLANNSKTAASSTEAWAQSLRTLSGQFGIEEIDAAKGAYVALNTQLIHGAENVDTLKDAFTLAKVTGASAADSVTAISAVVNSFGAKAGTTSQIVDDLFTSVKQGGFEINQFSQSIGRVSSLASTLGISFREVLATLDAARIKGVRADEAFSELDHLFSQLLKPSAELKTSFDQLGVATAEQGVATRGYVGFIQQLIKNAEATGEPLGSLFTNIRGLNEVFRESNDGFEQINKNLDEFSANAGKAKKGLDDVQEAAGDRTHRVLVQLKNDAESVWTKFLQTSDAAVKALQKFDDEGEKAEKARHARIEERQRLGLSSIPRGQDEGRFGDAGLDFGGQVATTFATAKIAPGTQVDLNLKQFQAQLQHIQELKAANFQASKDQVANIEATTKEFLKNLDKRRVEFDKFNKDQVEKERDSALEQAKQFASPEQLAKLQQERVDQLQRRQDSDLSAAKKSRGEDFILGTSLEDAKKAADEVIKIREQQRDAALKTLKPEDREQGLSAILGGNFSSLSGLGQPGDELRKAQDELDQAKLERNELEQKSLDILKQKGEELKKQKDLQLNDAALFKQAQAAFDRGDFAGAQAFNSARTGLASQPGNIEAQIAAAETALRANPTAATRDALDALVHRRNATTTADSTNTFAIFQQIAALRNVPGQEGLTQGLFAAAGLGTAASGFGLGRTDQDSVVKDTSKGVKAIVDNSEHIATAGARQVEVYDKIAESVIGADTAITNFTISARKAVDEFTDRQNTLALQFARATGTAASDLVSGAVGNLLGFEDGGTIPGTFNPSNPDSMLIRAAPGETVLSREMTRDFAPVIREMFAGRLPGFQSGGQVNHLHGGLNVTVMGGSTSQETIGQISRGLERAWRRGTFRLGGAR